MMDENIIELTDENGDVIQFELLDLVEYNGINYVVLLPVEDFDGEFMILQYGGDSEDDDEDENYYGIDDDEIVQTIFEIFKENNKEIFEEQEEQ